MTNNEIYVNSFNCSYRCILEELASEKQRFADTKPINKRERHFDMSLYLFTYFWSNDNVIPFQDVFW